MPNPYSKKRIAVMVDWFDPGYKAGGTIQSCVNFVKSLHQEYELFVITSDRDMGDKHSYKGIKVNQWTLYDNNVQVFYASPGKAGFFSLNRLFNFIKPDYVYLNSMYSFKFTIIPLLLKRLNMLKSSVVLAPSGMLQQGAIQFKKAKKKLFIKGLNLLSISNRILFHATDQQENLDVRSHFPAANKVFIIPSFPRIDKVEWSPACKEPGLLQMIFLSRIDPKKNLLYLLKLLQKLPPGARIILSIWGEIENEHYWQQCLGIIKNMPVNITVTYHGTVPNKDIFNLYKQYHLFVLPTFGENFGHAIYEALLAGKPVLISNKTPWRDLEAQKVGFDIDLMDTHRFADAIQYFANMDQHTYNGWSNAAWVFANNFSNRSDIKERYLELFN